MDNLSGTYICPKCSKKYKWEYLEVTRNKYTDSSYHAVALSEDTVRVTKDESMSDQAKYRFKCECPKCNEPNSFDYLISKG